MKCDVYARAMNLAVDARGLLEEIQRLQASRQTNDDPNPFAPLVAASVAGAARDSGLEDALRRFEELLYDRLPDIRGEHDKSLHVQDLDNGFVQFQGNLDEEFYADLRVMAEAAGFDWHEYEVGIGVGGIEILVSFGTSLSATLVYEFLKKLAEKELDPDIDSVAAVELCKLDVLSRGGAAVFDVAFAKRSPVAHAKYEVYLHAAGDERLYVLLVRPNGEICGRKEGRLQVVSEKS